MLLLQKLIIRTIKGGKKMKKKYLAPTLNIEKFYVEDIITESVTDVLQTKGIVDSEMGNINFDDGNTLESIDYTKFFK